MSSLAYQRVMLKLSGEALMGERESGLDLETVDAIAADIREICELGVRLGLVVGGGNICRGVSAATHGMTKVKADSMGMLATVINGLALQDALDRHGVRSVVLTAFPVGSICEPFSREKALRHLESGEVVICAGGTGNPCFTTDTAAALRAVEMDLQVVLKATQVDGVYTSDPHKDPNAARFDRISYAEMHKRRLEVMDLTAVSLCMENRLPIVVFNMRERGNVKRVLVGEPVGTVVEEGA